MMQMMQMMQMMDGYKLRKWDAASERITKWLIVKQKQWGTVNIIETVYNQTRLQRAYLILMS